MKALLIFTAIGIILFFSSCEKEHGPSVNDHFLMYDIPHYPVTQDYIVGVKYHYTPAYSSKFDRMSEPSLLGKYARITDPVPGSPSIKILDRHLEWMNGANIDFVQVTIRSGNMALANYRSDSSYLAAILNSPNIGNVKIAIEYDMGSSFGLANPTSTDSSRIIENRGLVGAYINDFTRFMLPFLKHEKYLRQNGKPVIFIRNAARLYSRNNVALNTQLRDSLKSRGEDVFLAGEQLQWTPPARYIDRLKDAVDAIYHVSYARYGDLLDRLHFFHQYTDQAWMYSKNMFNSWGAEYIPNISPSYNENITSSRAQDYYFPIMFRDPDYFATTCNLAKKNADVSRIVLIDSWNDFNFDTQLEPTNGYGQTFLNIVKTQFKVN